MVIAIADVVMSLDNVIAVAAAAHGDRLLLVLGLVISVPLVVYGATLLIALIMSGLSLLNELCRRPEAESESLAEEQQHKIGEKMHMDLVSETGHLPVRTIVARGALFFAYLLGFMAVMAVIGVIPTAAIFVVFFMRFEAQERWSVTIPYAVCLVLGIYVGFDMFMSVPWPPTLAGQLFPALKAIPSV